MEHIKSEILSLKEIHYQMWNMVYGQVTKALLALEKYDKELAREIISREKMVNSQELLVDRQCENFIALFTPVAIDLRFVISLMKINNNLERIGDFAESIATFVLRHQSKKIPEDLYQHLQLKKMGEYAIQMIKLSEDAFHEEDTQKAGRVLSLDDMLDEINHKSISVLAEYIKANPDSAEEMLNLYGVIRRMERIGDRCSNIAEDVVFYVDAKELRHNNP